MRWHHLPPPPPGGANTFTVTDSSKIFKLYLKQTAGAGPTADPSWTRLMKARAGCYVGRLDVSCTKKESADGWSSRALPARPEGPCDILGAAGTACVAAHSVVRALYANYTAALYEGPRPPGYEAMEKQGASILATGGGQLVPCGRDIHSRRGDDGKLRVPPMSPTLLCTPTLLLLATACKTSKGCRFVAYPPPLFSALLCPKSSDLAGNISTKVDV